MIFDTWFKIRLLHGVIAFFIASFCAAIGVIAVFFGSVYIFNYLNPHDGMNGLGGIMLALPAGGVIWVLIFVQGMQYQHARAWRKQEQSRVQAQRASFPNS